MTSYCSSWTRARAELVGKESGFRVRDMTWWPVVMCRGDQMRRDGRWRVASRWTIKVLIIIVDAGPIRSSGMSSHVISFGRVAQGYDRAYSLLVRRLLDQRDLLLGSRRGFRKRCLL
jgi:hypothetical protein